MSKLVENITKYVYTILYGTTEYDKYGITPIVKITKDKIKIVTPPSSLFPTSELRLQNHRREMGSIILSLRKRYKGRILSGDDGYYKIHVSDDLTIKRIEDNKGFYYKVYIPFIKLPGYQDYLDVLPEELLRIIFIKSQLSYDDAQDSFSKVFNSPYFSWKRLFQEVYPKGYETAVTIPSVPEEKDWRELYDIVVGYKLTDFTVGIHPYMYDEVILITPLGTLRTELKACKVIRPN